MDGFASMRSQLLSQLVCLPFCAELRVNLDLVMSALLLSRLFG